MPSLIFDVSGRLYPEDQEYSFFLLPTDTPQSVAKKTNVSRHARTSPVCYWCLKILRLTLVKKCCDWECNKRLFLKPFVFFHLLRHLATTLKCLFSNWIKFMLSDDNCWKTPTSILRQNEQHDQIEIMANHDPLCKRINNDKENILKSIMRKKQRM